MHELDPRRASFSYDYKMRCSNCGSTCDLASSDYAAQVNDAHTNCPACGADIHFGRAVIALRDPEDPFLLDARVRETHWFHTTTSVLWPTSSAEEPPNCGGGWLLSTEAARLAHARRLDQALHLGTYEAAIESMLRRMRDQGNSVTQFYLFRVQLRTDAVIEPGYRDENVDLAADVTQAELGSVDVVRYLNAFESPGSISLAVRPRVILSAEVASIPPAVERPLPPAVVGAHTHFRTRMRQLENLRPSQLNAVEQLQTEMAHRRGQPFQRPPTSEQWEEIAKLDKLYAKTFLPSISPMVVDAFDAALKARMRDYGEECHSNEFAQLYMRFASLLVNPSSILSAMRPAPGLARVSGALTETGVLKTDD